MVWTQKLGIHYLQRVQKKLVPKEIKPYIICVGDLLQEKQIGKRDVREMYKIILFTSASWRSDMYAKTSHQLSVCVLCIKEDPVIRRDINVLQTTEKEKLKC